MATTITYKITKLKRKLDTGYVFSVEFDITGTNDSHTTTRSESLTFNGEFVEGMTPYEYLFEELVLEWIKKSSEDLENEVKNTIQEKITPTVGEGIPWS